MTSREASVQRGIKNEIVIGEERKRILRDRRNSSRIAID